VNTWYNSTAKTPVGIQHGVYYCSYSCQKKKTLTGTFIGQECWKFAGKIVARNGMQSTSKNHTQNASRKILSLRHQQKLGYSNENEKTTRIYTFGTLSSLKRKN
jgi:hypothetical protein